MDRSKIVYITPDEKSYLYDGKTLQACELENSKKYFTALLVPPSALFMYSQKVSPMLSDEELSIKLDIAIYDEGGADENDIYNTAFVRHKLPSDEEIADVFGLTDKQTTAMYGKVAEKAHTIDFMSPAILMYESLYENSTPNPLTDIYIYVGDNESFVSIYHGGKYIAHRSMDSLDRMCKQTVLDVESLKGMLKTKGLNEDEYEEQEALSINTIKNSFARSIERVVNTINHKQGIFGLKGVDRVFIDFEGEVIAGLDELFENFGLEISDIKPIIAKHVKDPKLYHDLIAAKYAYGVANKKHNNVNLSPYEREKPFYETHVGHLSAVIAACMLFSLIVIYIGQVLISSKQDDIYNVQRETERVTISSKKTLNVIQRLKNEYQKLHNRYLYLENEDILMHKAQSAVPSISSEAFQRQIFVNDALAGLDMNSLALKALEQIKSNKLKLYIVTTPTKEKDIARFIDFMYQRGYEKSFTNNIKKDEGYYESIVEVER